MKSAYGLQAYSGLLLALSLLVAGGHSEAAGVSMKTNAPVQLFIPNLLIADAAGSHSVVKVKGLETPGRSLATETCRIRYTVFDQQGKSLLLYPNNQTACVQVLLSVNTKRGVWQEFPLDLGQIQKARLVPGTYWFSVHIYLSEIGNGKRQDLPVVVSNTATLRVK